MEAEASDFQIRTLPSSEPDNTNRESRVYSDEKILRKKNQALKDVNLKDGSETNLCMRLV